MTFTSQSNDILYGQHEKARHTALRRMSRRLVSIAPLAAATTMTEGRV